MDNPTAKPATDLRDRIAAVLAAHEPCTDYESSTGECIECDLNPRWPDATVTGPTAGWMQHAAHVADAVIAALGLTKIEMLARSWHANYDAIPANDPRDPTDADIAYDDAGFQILHALGLEAND